MAPSKREVKFYQDIIEDGGGTNGREGEKFRTCYMEKSAAKHKLVIGQSRMPATFQSFPA
jgi:hypothetical protein